MSDDLHDPGGAAIPMPRLSDDAFVQIHDFIGHLLDLFEAHYGDQIHLFYEERPVHNIVSTEPIYSIDDPPSEPARVQRRAPPASTLPALWFMVSMDITHLHRDVADCRNPAVDHAQRCPSSPSSNLISGPSNWVIALT